mgnify:CR=1 FL=1
MKEYFFPLRERREIAKETMAFWFDIRGADFAFKAGQYADFELLSPAYTDAEGDIRTFSIASSPNEKETIMIATRMRNTAFKNNIKELPLGSRFRVKGPLGSFTLHNDAQKPAIFLAGGIGITPMRSIVAWATEERLPPHLYLLYSNPTPEATAFLDDFERFAVSNTRFMFMPTVTDSDDASWRYERGRIGGEMIRKYVPDVVGSIYYVAGPPAMVEAMREVLDGLGVDSDNVKSEEFGGYG